MKIKGLDVLLRPGFDADGNRRTWNYRIVRRHDNGRTWLEITAVQYRNGEPCAFAIELGPVRAAADLDETPNAGELVNRLIDTLSRMRDACDEPILHEIDDFKDGE